MARHKEFDPDEALLAARQRFHRNGYAQSSMQQLLVDMQIGQGSFYATFGSKQQLFERALDHYTEASIGFMVQWLRAATENGGEDATRRLEELLLTLAARYGGDPEHRGCLLVNTVTELAPHDPKLAAALRKHWERLEGALRGLLATAKEQGRLPAHTDPRALARVFLAVIHGMTVRSKYDPRPEVLRSIAKASIAAFL